MSCLEIRSIRSFPLGVAIAEDCRIIPRSHLRCIVCCDGFVFCRITVRPRNAQFQSALSGRMPSGNVLVCPSACGSRGILHAVHRTAPEFHAARTLLHDHLRLGAGLQEQRPGRHHDQYFCSFFIFSFFVPLSSPLVIPSEAVSLSSRAQERELSLSSFSSKNILPSRFLHSGLRPRSE